MKVSLYVRESGTRKYTKANKKYYEPGTVFVLRYGSTWETVGEVKLIEAERARLNRSVRLLEGWQPAVKPKPNAASLMLDAAMDAYLSEICSSRKKKTHQAYTVALRYFYECVGNKPIKDITRGDLVKFSVFLREDKGQSPRSAVVGFLFATRNGRSALRCVASCRAVRGHRSKLSQIRRNT
jgi:hypothetical protein